MPTFAEITLQQLLVAIRDRGMIRSQYASLTAQMQCPERYTIYQATFIMPVRRAYSKMPPASTTGPACTMQSTLNPVTFTQWPSSKGFNVPMTVRRTLERLKKTYSSFTSTAFTNLQRIIWSNYAQAAN